MDTNLPTRFIDTTRRLADAVADFERFTAAVEKTVEQAINALEPIRATIEARQAEYDSNASESY